MDILEKIAAHKRLEIETMKIDRPMERLRRDLASAEAGRFKSAISDPSRANIIAELKKGSPSKGILDPKFDPGRLTTQYLEGGAAALSVLTDEKFFYGAWDNLRLVREARGSSSHSGPPLLCKEFIIDSYQLYYARSMGAEAALLITRLHGEKALTEFLAVGTELGLDCLVEVHDRAELATALNAGAEIIGVNNRNLSDFSVRLETSEELAALMPAEIVKVAESGIHTHGDITRLQAAGYTGFLVGEALVTSDDPAARLRELRGVR